MDNPSLHEIIDSTKAQYLHTQARMAQTLANTPDDRINWSPSPTARTPIELVAHGAMGISGILMMLEEQPRLQGEFGKYVADEERGAEQPGAMNYPYNSVPEMDAAFRRADQHYKTREAALALLEQNGAEYLAWLEKLTPEKYASTLQIFVGTFPMSFAITVPALHLNAHIAQMEYVQTIYGDRDWYV